MSTINFPVSLTNTYDLTCNKIQIQNNNSSLNVEEQINNNDSSITNLQNQMNLKQNNLGNTISDPNNIV